MKMTSTIRIAFFTMILLAALAHPVVSHAARLISSAHHYTYQNKKSDTEAEARAFMVGVMAKANKAMAIQNRDQQFKEIDGLVSQYADIRRTGRFTLGQYARRMTSEQAERFYPLFDRYATNIYQEILSNYTGYRLIVTDAIVRSNRDIVINSVIEGARPGDPFANSVIQWRLYKTSKGFKVVDAGADNIWLAIEQRSQFTSIISNNGGGTKGIEALINQLDVRINK